MDAADSNPASVTPVPLLPDVAAGRAAAVDACIDRYGPLVWKVVRPACRSDGDAEDVTQETFIDLWKHAGRYDPGGGSEAAFVATVARRRLIDHLRRRGRREDLADMRHAVCEQRADAAAELDDEARAAREAMKELSDGQRQVIHLSVVGGLRYPEIAEALSMPLSTVKAHARRGVAKVRDALARRADAARVRRQNWKGLQGELVGEKKARDEQ